MQTQFKAMHHSLANANAGTDIDITGTGNNLISWPLLDEVTAPSPSLIRGLGGDSPGIPGWTHATHTGWNMKKVGSGDVQVVYNGRHLLLHNHKVMVLTISRS
jgi:hypothetical protein